MQERRTADREPLPVQTTLGRRVRIVEDDPSLATMLLYALTDAGFRPVVTTSGFASLLTDAPWEGIDSALVDIRLGEETTGKDILRYLAGQFPQIRRVVLTAFSDTPLGDLAHLVLTKPSSLDALTAAL